MCEVSGSSLFNAKISQNCIIKTKSRHFPPTLTLVTSFVKVMKVITFLVVSLLPTIVSGLFEKYVLAQDTLSQVDTNAVSSINSVPTGGGLTPMGGTVNTNLVANCKKRTSYRMFVLTKDLTGTGYVNAYLPVGVVVGGLPLYDSATMAFAGYISETIILGGNGCIKTGAISILGTGAGGMTDQVIFQGIICDKCRDNPCLLTPRSHHFLVYLSRFLLRFVCQRSFWRNWKLCRSLGLDWHYRRQPRTYRDHDEGLLKRHGR